jgi:hypothetical protein
MYISNFDMLPRVLKLKEVQGFVTFPNCHLWLAFITGMFMFWPGPFGGTGIRP